MKVGQAIVIAENDEKAHEKKYLRSWPMSMRAIRE